MNIFLTGGTGFVGSNMLNELLHRGHTIYAQRRPNSSPRVQPEFQPIWIERPLDEDFSDVLSSCEMVIHLASHAPNPPYAPLDEYIYWNVYAASKLLMTAKKHGIKNYIIAGSCFEYGKSAENQEFVHPSTDTQAIISYPVSKAIASHLFASFAKSENLKIKLLRIFQVYGTGEDSKRFWPSLKHAAENNLDFPMSHGTQIRDFISVDQVVDIFMQELDFSSFIDGNFYIRNVGTGKPQSLIDFANFWWRQFEAKGQLLSGQINARPGEIHRLVANVEDRHIE